MPELTPGSVALYDELRELLDELDIVDDPVHARAICRRITDIQEVLAAAAEPGAELAPEPPPRPIDPSAVAAAVMEGRAGSGRDGSEPEIYVSPWFERRVREENVGWRPGDPVRVPAEYRMLRATPRRAIRTAPGAIRTAPGACRPRTRPRAPRAHRRVARARARARSPGRQADDEGEPPREVALPLAAPPSQEAGGELPCLRALR